MCHPPRPLTILAIALLGLAGCRGATPQEPDPVKPPLPDGLTMKIRVAASAYEQDSLTVSASVYRPGGHWVFGAAISWRSTNPLVATVDPAGFVVTHRPGSTYLVASHARRNGSVLQDSAQLKVRARGVPAALIPHPQLPPLPLGVPEGRYWVWPHFLVLGPDGRPAAGVRVHAAVVEGGGSTARPRTVSDSTGAVYFPLTLGPSPGANVIEAYAEGTALKARITVMAGQGPYLAFRPDSMVFRQSECSAPQTLVAGVYDRTGPLSVITPEFVVGDTSVIFLEYLLIGASSRGRTRLVRPKRIGETRVIANFEGLSDTINVRVEGRCG